MNLSFLNVRSRMLPLLVLQAVLPIRAAAQLPPVTTGTCSITKMSYVTSRDTASTSTSSTAFTALPDMHVYFDVAEGQCVKIEFSMVLSSQTPQFLDVRVLFDAITEPVAPASIRVAAIPFSQYQVFTFLVPIESGLGPGNHNVQIEVKSSAGGPISTSKRKLTVLHN